MPYMTQLRSQTPSFPRILSAGRTGPVWAGATPAVTPRRQESPGPSAIAEAVYRRGPGRMESGGHLGFGLGEGWCHSSRGEERALGEGRRESKTLSWTLFGRLRLCAGNFSLYRCLCVVLVLCFDGLRLWGDFVRAQFSSVPRAASVSASRTSGQLVQGSNPSLAAV